MAAAPISLREFDYLSAGYVLVAHHEREHPGLDGCRHIGDGLGATEIRVAVHVGYGILLDSRLRQSADSEHICSAGTALDIAYDPEIVSGKHQLGLCHVIVGHHVPGRAAGAERERDERGDSEKFEIFHDIQF